MFAASISRQSAMMSQPASWYFNDRNISINTTNRMRGLDTSYESTLKALFAIRGLRDIYLELCVTNFSMYGSWDSDELYGSVMSSMNYPDANRLTIYHGNYTGDDDAFLKHDGFNYEEQGFTYQPLVRKFFGDGMRVFLFVNPRIRSAIVVTDQLDLRKYHWLQCVTPMFIPWYFQNEEGKLVVTAEEQKLLNTLNANNADNYLSALQEVYDNMGIELTWIAERLKNVEIRSKEQRYSNLMDEISSMRSDIETMTMRIADNLRKIEERNLLAFGIKEAIAAADGNSELFEYVTGNKAIKILSINDTEVKYMVKSYLDTCNESLLEDYLENERSYLFSNLRGISKEDFTMFLKAAFIDQKVRMKTCAPFSIDIGRYYGGAISGGEYYDGKPEYNEYYPNPHIYHFACIDGFRPTLNACLQNGDYIGFINTTITSASSLNFADSTVCGRFVSEICNFRDSKKFIELPNGEVVTLTKAIEYLKEEENHG